MRIMALVAIGSAAALCGCAAVDGSWWPPRHAPAATPAVDPEASAKQAARSIWGVVPSTPRRKADLRADLIKGSAVAISADTLLANCLVVGARTRVGLVRHNKYRIARVAPTGQGQLCRLTVTAGPLNPTAGYRSFADLRVGEPLVALASRTSAEVAAAPGWLAGKGSADDPFLEATAAVPAGNRSAVLVDGFGNLIGLGAAAPVAGGLVLAVPVEPGAASDLANRDLGGTEVLLAALTPAPRAQPRQPPILLPLGSDDRDGSDRAPASRQTARAVDQADGASAPAPAVDPRPGSSGGSDPAGADPSGTETAGAGTGGSDSGAASGGGGTGTGGSGVAASGSGTAAGASDGASGAGPDDGPAAVGSNGAEATGSGREVGADDEGQGRGRGRGNRGRSGDEDDGERGGRGRGDRDGGDDDDGGRGSRGRGDSGRGSDRGRGGDDGRGGGDRDDD